MKRKLVTAATIGLAAIVTTAANAQPPGAHHKHARVTAPYRAYHYRGDFYNGGYSYGAARPTRYFWGKGTSGVRGFNGRY